MYKILIEGVIASENLGAMGMLRGLEISMNENFTNSIVYCFSVEIDKPKRSHIRGIDKVIYIPRSLNRKQIPIRIMFAVFFFIFSKIRLPVSHLTSKDSVLSIYSQVDAVIDLSGDTISDEYGFKSILALFIRTTIARLLKKPFIIFPQSIGPFKNPISKIVMSLTLKNINYVFAREFITLNLLKNMNLHSRSNFSPDLAFNLDMKESQWIRTFFQKIDHSKKKIGISISQHIWDKSLIKTDKNQKNNYLDIMVNFIEFLLNENHIVILIPHVRASRFDDYSVSKIIKENIEKKSVDTIINNLFIIEEKLSSQETKHIISKCFLFIGARMHANIAAITTCVPTIAISYSHKYTGIMKLYGLENYVIPYLNLNFEILLQKYSNLTRSQGQIVPKMREADIKMKKRVSLPIKYLKKLLDGDL